MQILRAWAVAAVILFATRSYAEVVVFGDSLSDTGNFAILTGGAIPPTPLYAPGRLSNGPIWVETLAVRLREPIPTPALQDGTNYAFNGARAVGDSPYGVPDVETQVATYLASNTNAANPRDWFVIWAGANDVFFGAANGEVDFVPNAVAAIKSAVVRLRAAGARKILVLNLPPLGQTPFVNQDPFLSVQLDSAAFAFNQALEKSLEPYANRTRREIVTLVDIEGLFNLVIAKPRWFRLRNVTESCTVFDPLSGLGGELKDGVSPKRYLFWDSVHPTTTGHEIIAKAASLTLRLPSVGRR